MSASMQYTHDQELAAEYAKAAFDRLRHEKLPPTPDNFELWYVYFSGQSPEVTRAIDVLSANRQKISQERCRELYEKYLSNDHNEERIRKAGDQINVTIQSVTGVVKNVRTATSAYSGKLGGVNNRIAAIKDPAELQKVLSSIMADTQAMIAQNQKLEDELDRSSHVMEELQSDLERVRREAMTDGLTALANRKAFDLEIERIAAEAKQSGTAFSLLMLDIDYFKSFNDNYGHQVGDQVLRLVARTLTDGVKGRDIAARYGGEEFAILLPETNLQGAVHVGNVLRKAIAVKDVINRNTGDKLGRITMSVGAAEFASGEEVTDLIERADAALYTAKHNGRNQVAAAPIPPRKTEMDAG